MGNVSTVVRVPGKFIPLIDAEVARRGCYTRTDAIGHILEGYFKDRTEGMMAQPEQKQEAVDDTIKAGEGALPEIGVRPRIRG